MISRVCYARSKVRNDENDHGLLVGLTETVALAVGTSPRSKAQNSVNGYASATLLVFLTGTAGARVVATNLWGASPGLGCIDAGMAFPLFPKILVSIHQPLCHESDDLLALVRRNR